MAEPLIVFDRVSRRFDMKPVIVTALDDVSLTIDNHAFVAITGPSGSGKSSLLNIIGFLDRPSSGQYRFQGQDVGPLPERDFVKLRRDSVGFVFQQFYLLPRLTARENVEVPLIYQRVSRAERHRRAEEALRRVGLEQRINHRPNEMSGGEQQRVAIARALVKNAPFILADEPTGNLDSKAGATILDLLTELHHEGRTILVVTHDEGIAQRLPRRIHMRDGKVVTV